MVPYLITFLISILLCGCAELAMKHSRAGGVLLLGAAVLPPVFLAGARDLRQGLYSRYGHPGLRQLRVHLCEIQQQSDHLYVAEERYRAFL